jgi:hypothetical protein
MNEMWHISCCDSFRVGKDKNDRALTLCLRDVWMICHLLVPASLPKQKMAPGGRWTGCVGLLADSNAAEKRYAHAGNRTPTLPAISGPLLFLLCT